MFSKLFWLDALERAIATAAQSVLLALAGQEFDKVAGGLEILAIAAAGGLLLSLVKSLAATQVGDNHSASLLPEVTTYQR